MRKEQEHISYDVTAGLGRGVTPADSLSSEMITTVERFAALRDSWDRLAEASNAAVFQTFDWSFLWWRHFGAHPWHQLRIIVYRKDGEIVGICPFFIRQVMVLGIPLFRELRVLGCGLPAPVHTGLKLEYGPSDYLDILAHPDYQSHVIQALFDDFAQMRNIVDEISFPNLRTDSILGVRLLQKQRENDRWLNITEADICPILSIPSSVDQYIHERKQKVRRRFVQAKKATDVLYEVRSVQSHEEVDRAYFNLVRLHQNHWNHLGYPGLFADRRFVEFQRELAHQFLDRGWLLFKTATHGGACVATHLTFFYNDCIYIYLSGFDRNSSVANRRPGLALILSMIQDGIDQKAKLLDFLRGDEGYKFDFTSEFITNIHAVLRNPAAALNLRVSLYRLCRGVYRILLLFFNEILLLRIHFKQHGLFSFLFQYIQFRILRIHERFRPSQTELLQEESGTAA